MRKASQGQNGFLWVGFVAARLVPSLRWRSILRESPDKLLDRPVSRLDRTAGSTAQKG